MQSSDAVAAWLFPPMIPKTGNGWNLVVRDGGEMIWPLLLIWPAAWSLYRLVIDFWPRALNQTLLFDLQSGPTLDTTKIRTLRRALERDVRSGKMEKQFDPRAYLLSRRRRVNRILYPLSIVTFVAAVLLAWRALATCTVATDAGIDDVGFLTGRHFLYHYVDVKSVRPECFLNHTDIKYQVEFRDGRHVDLLYPKDLPEKFCQLEADRRPLKAFASIVRTCGRHAYRFAAHT